MQAIYLPRNLDEPAQLMLWSADEVLPGLVVALMGMLMNQGTIGLILGFLTVKLFRKFKDGRPEGYLLHAMYYIGFISNKGLSMPNPYIREFYS